MRVYCSEIRTRSERPICESCRRNFSRISKSGSIGFNKECHSCQEKRLTGNLTTQRWKRSARYSYLKYRKSSCERCGFIPEHVCQLDVDHRDGSKANNDPSNLATLCANCHRLKTHTNKDHLDTVHRHMRAS